MSTNYPELTFKDVYPLLTFMLEVKKDPTLLDKSPYDDAVKNALRELFFRNETNAFSQEKSLENMDLEQETIRLYETMKNIELGEVLDAREKIALVKLQASSLKDLLDMMKESKRIKNIRYFEDTIFNILTDEQKEKVKTLIM
jgi:hypothetical protein